MIRGHWQHQGEEFRDELVRLFVDVPDTAETHAVFVADKESLKTRFQQLDVWITTHPVEVI